MKKINVLSLFDGIACKYGDCGEAKLHLISKVIEETIDYE